LASLLSLGCSSGRANCTGASCNNGGDGGTHGALSISPAQVTIMVSGQPAIQQFTATSVTDGDVSDKVTWSVGDATLGNIDSKGLFTTMFPLAHGGVESILANYKGNVGAASVTLVYQAPDVIDPSAPAGASGDFGGPPSSDTNETPKTVYPFGGTMLARNINQMNIQWIGNNKDAEYKIHITGATIDSSFYVGAGVCQNGSQCSYKPQDMDWQTIALSSSGQEVQMQISATAGNGQPVATSSMVPLDFSPEDVMGGLYYFSTSVRGIKRVPFGASTATDFIPNGNETGCAGCHAVSHDGKKVSAVFGGGDGFAGMVDGANGQQYLVPVDMTQKKYVWNFETFNPDGSQMITNWAGKLSLRDGNTGALIMDIPQSNYGNGMKEAVMPEWSPDGKNIVFIGVPQDGFIGSEMSQGFPLPAGDWILGNAGSVMVMPYNDGQFGMATEVVPFVTQSEYHFYPAWSPDSQWIVFATGKFPGSSPTAANNGVDTSGKCMSYDQDSARLRLVKAAGGAPFELSAATHAMNKTSTWPKFAPFIQGGGNLVFITFSSKFAYGFVVPDGARPQLWMSAIDLNKANAEGGIGDPSYPPFWLPFQDPTQNNHEGIWTNDVACNGNGNGDCPPEFTCENGMCVPGVG
jgi:hypothetical protein